MAVVRHFALNLVRQVADKRSIKRRRKRASRVVRQQVAGRGDVCGSSRPPWLGVETQRQWSDKAILRTTPVLLGLFSIVTVWANDLSKSRKFEPRTTAWYPKEVLTFSDAIAAVRREIWHHQISFMSRPSRDSIEIPYHIWQRMENALAHAS